MTDLIVVDSHSESDTQRLGRKLAEALVPGLVLALNGELGSGKTNLVRSICHGLGADQSAVNSPTFVLMQSYLDGRIPVVHFDTYRLADVDEFLAIGGDEYLLDSELICFVEWADRLADVLPADHLTISMEQTGETSRRFSITASGPLSQSVLGTLQTLFKPTQ